MDTLEMPVDNQLAYKQFEWLKVTGVQLTKSNW